MRVVLTREAERSADLTRRLEAVGHRVDHVPLTRIVDGDPFPDPAGYDGVLFTSVNAVRRAPENAAWPRVGAVGPVTAVALRERGIPVAVVGTGGGAELALAWGPAAGQKLLLPQAAQSHPALEAQLRDWGAEVVVARVYRSEPIEEIDTRPFEAAGLICFFAPTQVRAYAALGVETKAKLWAHGPTTREALHEHPQLIDDLPI